MLDGHFDYGNGYHGRVYLNPHQLFRHPSTIWRFAQDLIDVLPGELVQRDRGGRRTGDRRRAARAHDRRPARQPPQPHAPAVQSSRRSTTIRPAASRCARSTAASSTGKRVLLADDVRNTGRDVRALRGARREAGGTVVATVEIYDRLRSDRRSRRAELRAGRIQGAGELHGGGCARCATRACRSQILIRRPCPAIPVGQRGRRPEGVRSRRARSLRRS